MKTGIGQSKYRNLVFLVFSTVTFSILYILTDHNLFLDPTLSKIVRTRFLQCFFLPQLNIQKIKHKQQ